MTVPEDAPNGGERYMVEIAFSPGTPFAPGAPSAPGADAAAPAKAGGIQPPTLPLEPFAYVPSEKLEAYFEARPSSTAEECIAAAAAKYDDLASQLERRANGGEDATVDAPPSP